MAQAQSSSQPKETPAPKAPAAGAKPSPAKPAAKPTQSKMHYYKSRMHGLSVVVKHDREDADPTTSVEKVRFQPYYENVEGDTVKIGYLATDNPVAVKALSNDGSVEELDKDEYEKATDTEREKKPARRAPY